MRHSNTVARDVANGIMHHSSTTPTIATTAIPNTKSLGGGNAERRFCLEEDGNSFPRNNIGRKHSCYKESHNKRSNNHVIESFVLAFSRTWTRTKNRKNQRPMQRNLPLNYSSRGLHCRLEPPGILIRRFPFCLAATRWTIVRTTQILTAAFTPGIRSRKKMWNKKNKELLPLSLARPTNLVLLKVTDAIPARLRCPQRGIHASRRYDGQRSKRKKNTPLSPP
mmetsp:Transcript_32571/g.76738  ORF Transcript_32571/g.76738 Transcript_32571/m.76738 type:complete len:223 (+) Transcript_32571:1750-2418(+)